MAAYDDLTFVKFQPLVSPRITVLRFRDTGTRSILLVQEDGTTVGVHLTPSERDELVRLLSAEPLPEEE